MDPESNNSGMHRQLLYRFLGCLAQSKHRRLIRRVLTAPGAVTRIPHISPVDGQQAARAAVGAAQQRSACGVGAQVPLSTFQSWCKAPKLLQSPSPLGHLSHRQMQRRPSIGAQSLQDGCTCP
jgi:hypothetical protein